MLSPFRIALISVLLLIALLLLRTRSFSKNSSHAPLVVLNQVDESRRSSSTTQISSPSTSDEGATGLHSSTTADHRGAVTTDAPPPETITPIAITTSPPPPPPSLDEYFTPKVICPPGTNPDPQHDPDFCAPSMLCNRSIAYELSKGTLIWEPEEKNYDPSMVVSRLPTMYRSVIEKAKNSWRTLAPAFDRSYSSSSLNETLPECSSLITSGFGGSSEPSPGKTNVDVLAGFAYGYNVNQVHHIPIAFEKYATGCQRLVMFVSGIRGHYYCEDQTKFPHVLCVDIASLNVGQHNPEVRRVFAFRTFLNKNYRAIRYFIQVDTRDSLIYNNVFDRLPHRILTDAFFGVTEAHLLKKEGWNMGNIATLAPLLGEYISNLRLLPWYHPVPVICSGFYGGSSHAVLHFLDVFADLSAFAPRSHGIDQGVFIVLLYGGLLPAKFPHRIILLDHTMGPIRHWYHKFNPAIHQNAAGKLTNCGGEPYGIVHQFDRYPQWNAAVASSMR